MPTCSGCGNTGDYLELFGKFICSTCLAKVTGTRVEGINNGKLRD